MAYRITDIEGIGPTLERKFRCAGIRTVEKLLIKGSNRIGRREIAKRTGIDENRILIFVNNADLFRVRGVSSQFAELLKGSGIESVKELRNRNPENLMRKLKQVNSEKRLVRQVPGLTQVRGFVEEANTLDPLVTH